MIQPRWHKVFADLWTNKTRTFLTALTIAVGVFAAGFVVTTGAYLFGDMDADYVAGNPNPFAILSESSGDIVPDIRYEHFVKQQ